MLFLELFGSFIELDLCRLGKSNFFFQLLLLSAHFYSKFFYLKIELPYFGIIFFFVLLESNVVFFFLFSCYGPLLKLFLVPVELEFDLFHFLIHSENPDLDVIKPFLIFWNYFIEFFDLVLESSALPFCDLP